MNVTEYLSNYVRYCLLSILRIDYLALWSLFELDEIDAFDKVMQIEHGVISFSAFVPCYVCKRRTKRAWRGGWLLNCCHQDDRSS